ncbi:hypothetical protein [Streptomyces atratus]|uniref:hypothetical protein n=1 Tax=Streptomyces atratus TaxID=1893 RepID=UPI00365A1D3C
MNTRRVNTAAGVINAAQKTRQTAAGIAMVLESAGLLQSPESAAELVALQQDRDGFREQRNTVFKTNEELLKRVERSGLARLQAENEARTVARERDALRARVAELEAAQTAALTPHVPYTDSPHCQADGDPWPCPTATALAPTAASVENPWERAVAGLNALVDADVIFHVEPDGHISAPFSDEHIEWDLQTRRWALTHDDHDGGTDAR